ncbi:hypothetical protein [Dolichospermum compactum]|uniref:hypothetical protein n=1 Tax=Dolichospermum compactum TaxID=136073 RepID=UPI0012FD2E49|nr:hypothetical protein [Dolichospermum compactum]
MDTINKRSRDLVPQGVRQKSKVKSNIGQAFWRLRMVDLFTPCCTRYERAL